MTSHRYLDRLGLQSDPSQTFNATEPTPEFLASLQKSGMFDASADRIGLEGYVRSDGTQVCGRLSGRPQGTFVWRLSRQNGGLVLSYVDSASRIIHVLYLLHADPSSGEISICVDRAHPRGYADITDIIIEWPSLYKISLLDLEAAELAANAPPSASTPTSTIATSTISTSSTLPASAADGAGSAAAPAAAAAAMYSPLGTAQDSLLTTAAAAPVDDSRYMMVRRSVEGARGFEADAVRDDVEARLASCPKGTFVVRYSASVPGDYTISVVSSSGAIVHSRISCLRSGFLLYDGHRYSSWSEFLASKREAGILSSSLVARVSSAEPAAAAVTAALPDVPPVRSPVAVSASARSSFADLVSDLEILTTHANPTAADPSAATVATITGNITPPHEDFPSFPAPTPASAVAPTPASAAAPTPATTTAAAAPAPSSPVASNSPQIVPTTTPITAAPTPAAPEPAEDSNVCVVCLDNHIDVILLECGHVCVCSSCAALLSTCPMCRGEITRSVKMFFAH